MATGGGLWGAGGHSLGCLNPAAERSRRRGRGVRALQQSSVRSNLRSFTHPVSIIFWWRWLEVGWGEDGLVRLGERQRNGFWGKMELGMDSDASGRAQEKGLTAVETEAQGQRGACPPRQSRSSRDRVTAAAGREVWNRRAGTDECLEPRWATTTRVRPTRGAAGGHRPARPLGTHAETHSVQCTL